MYRPTYANIHLAYLKTNLELIKKMIPDKKVVPVIKANAYGHGSVVIMEYLIQQGIDYFAVSLLEEALELREKNKEVGIIILGAISKEQLKIISDNQLDIFVYSNELLNDALESQLPLRIHLKYDTGMHRYGFTNLKAILNAIYQIENHPTVKWIGLATHFATADDNEIYYRHQVEMFKELLTHLPRKPEMIHMSNSASTVIYESMYDFTTHVRVGIALYGLSLEHLNLGLKPVMSLHSHIVQIKKLKKGEFVSYGATYQAKEDEYIGVIPIGYADGWLRVNRDAMVEINHKLYPLVGTICMDAALVKIDQSVQLGAEVILFGGLVSTKDVADHQKTIVYEVCTNISARVPRRYV
ncbi:MAG: alanine racemase [Acholeplasmataceae bacterium]|nr:alanine racemase [Acholeplasmataceae bacterium]